MIMLLKPTRPFVQALHSVVHSPPWKDIGVHLELELRATLQQMVSCSDPVQIHALRGRAQVLSELLEVASTTRDLLDKLK
jgi:hypothetical protein